ncbi:MAG: hypothetical protein ABFS23_07595 [Pseudomonadota bacterium]
MTARHDDSAQAAGAAAEAVPRPPGSEGIAGPRWPLLIPAVLSVGFLWLWPHLFFEDATGIHSGSRTVWADFAIHLTYAQRFAQFPPGLWFDHQPLYFGAPFDYPFITGLISGLLLRATDSEVVAMLAPSMVAAAALPWLVYGFLRVTDLRPSWAAAGTLVFYLAGGLGWTTVLSGGTYTPPVLEASMVEGTLFKFGRLVHLLLPQRALQFGLPLGLLVIIGLARWLRSSQKAGDGNPPIGFQILLGCAAGLLFSVHVHSFLAVAAASAAMLGVALAPWPPGGSDAGALHRLRWVAGFAPFAIAASAVSLGLYFYFAGEVREGFLHPDPGWLANDFLSWLGLWWANGGIFYFAAAYALFTPRLWRSRVALSLSLAGWILFGALNLVRFQPWDWDNTKLELWAFLLLLPAVMLLMQSWWNARKARPAVLLVLFSLLPTGMLDLHHLVSFERHTYRLWSAEQQQLARRFRDLAEPVDLVVVADRAHDWVSALAGRQILLGWIGSLWAYGIDTTERRAEVRTIFQGGERAADLLGRYDVRWVVIDDDARRNYQADETFFANRFRLALRQGDTRIYEVPPDPGQ